MKQLVKLGIATLKRLLAVVMLGAVAQAGNPYLPLIGPPPLRVEAVKKSVASFKIEATPAIADTNPPVIVDPKPAPTVTNAINPINLSGPSIFVAPPPPIVESPDGTLGDTFTSSVFPMPTPDLLGITPQMLATYFHPVQMGTNSPALVGPFRVIFMPPMPPDKSSHAEYIVK